MHLTTLCAELEQKLEGDTLKLYKEIELPLLEVLAEMEINGVHVDRKHLLKLSGEIKIQLAKLETDIFSLAGEEFNINSPKQLSTILFVKLNTIPEFLQNII